ncbi:hypothetical protein KI387_033842, partial [Taxus chinensis]
FEAEKSDDEDYSNDVNEQEFYKQDNTLSGCRRGHENSSVVPNFVDLRKENTKPSTGQTGLTSSLGSGSHGQPKSGSRESGNEEFSYETNGFLPPSRSTNNKEEKHRHNKEMRKSCTSMSEIKDISDPTYEGVALAPLKVSKEASEQVFYVKYTKRNNDTPSEVEPFLRKGNGILGPSVGLGITKMKASMAAKNMKNVEDEGQADIQDGEETIDEFGNVQSLESLEGIAEESDKFDLVDSSDAQADSDTYQNVIYRKE